MRRDSRGPGIRWQGTEVPGQNKAACEELTGERKEGQSR